MKLWICVCDVSECGRYGMCDGGDERCRRRRTRVARVLGVNRG